MWARFGAIARRWPESWPVGPRVRPPTRPAQSNQTLFDVTHCEEDAHPFSRTANPLQRLNQAHAALDAIDPATFAPFGPQIAFLLSNVPICRFWPMLPEQPSFGNGPKPNIPVLLIHGEFDLRSTLASTETVAGEYFQGKVLVVPNEGHSPTRTPTGGCARAAAVNYIAHGIPPEPCPRVADPFAPRGLVPRSVKAAGGPIAAAQLTVADAFDELDAGSLLRVAAEPKVRGGGLRFGRFHGSKKGLVLFRYTFIRGFPVTGLVRPSGAVFLRIPRGKLRFENGAVTGRIRRKDVTGLGALQQQSFAAKLAAGG